LPAPPQRIVITGKALIMIADAVYTFGEASARIVALGKISQGTGNFIELIDPTYAEKATLQQDAGAEQIAALQPDLVILKSYLAETVGAPIEKLGIPVIYVDFETPEQYARDLEILGQVFQNQARAREIITYYQSRVTQIREIVAGVAVKPNVLMLYYTDRDGSVAFNVPPLAWMQTQLVEMAGGFPVWKEANPGEGWMQVTLEQVAAWDADDILIISYVENPSNVVERLKKDPQWQALRAVKVGHLYAFPSDLYSWDQPDTRWILGLTWLAARLHPERFPQMDILGEAQRFYQVLYGLDPAFFEEKIRSTFQGDLP
jgi:iron complex transport system substrate-binding protein